MVFQAKLVNPNGSPKAVVATHDRVASGKEFHLFSSLLGMMALGAIPTERLDDSGHQMFELIEPEVLVRRAEQIVQQAMYTATINEWVVEAADIDKIYQDREDGEMGFRTPPPQAAPNSDDDIPF